MTVMCINCKHCRRIGGDDPILAAKYKGSGLYRCKLEEQVGVYKTGAWARECDKYEGKKLAF